MVDDALIVLGQDFQAFDFGYGKGKSGNAVVAMKLRRVQGISQKFKSAAWLAVIHGTR